MLVYFDKNENSFIIDGGGGSFLCNSNKPILIFLNNFPDDKGICFKNWVFKTPPESLWKRLKMACDLFWWTIKNKTYSN